jgi:fibronectin-binding autotransporter adhesin
MAIKDFVVKNGLQVTSNVLVGAYVNTVASTTINNGIAASGNVGIGTNTVRSGDRLNIVGGNVNIMTDGFGLVFSDGTRQTSAATSAAAAGGTGAIQYADGTALAGDNTLFFFDGTNKIGIGTNDVTNAGFHAKTSLPALFDTASGDDRQLRVGNSATTAATFGYDPSSVAGYLRADPTGTNMITWTNSGVGINGVDTPANALDVSGGIVIGSGGAYAGSAIAPSNGMIVQGAVGIGTVETGTNVKLGVFGGNLVVGDSGTGVVFPDNSFQTTAYPGSGGVVTSFSAGTTGFTPNTGTTGAITLAGTLNAANGGTGQSSYTIGDLLYASGSTALSKLAGVATGNSLISGGVGAAPSWGKIGLTTHVNGILPVANGGTNSSSASGTALDNITGFSGTGLIRRTGAGTYTFGTAVSLTTEITGTLGATNGGTGQSTVTTGDLLYGSATNTWSKLAGVATGNVLISGGTGTAPSWGKIGLTTHVSGILPVANGGTNSSSASGTALDNITGFSGTGIIRRTGAGTYTFGTAVNLTSEVTGVLPLANGGTNKNLTASNGGIVYTDADSMEVLSASATSGNVLISGGAGAPSWGQYYTSSNVASSIVSRDASGNFSAGTITAATGVTVSAGGINVTGASQFTGNVSIAGNLIMQGNAIMSEANVLVISDPIIYLGEDNPGNVWDLGIVGAYTDDSYKHTGLLHRHTDGKWVLFDNLITEPGQTINWSQPGLEYDNMLLGAIEVVSGNVDISGAGTGVVFPDNSFQTTAYPGSGGVVTSFSAGTTGFTPNSASTGAITLAGTLNAANGGTGQSSYTIGDLLYASGSTALSKLAGVATGNVLLSGGTGTAPSWGKIGLTTHVSGILPVANGGTNSSSASGTALDNITGFSGTGLIRRTGAGTYTFGTAVSLTTEITGTLPVGNGGTGATTLTLNGVLYGNGTSAVQITAQGGTNTVLTANGGAPSFSATPTLTSLTTTGDIAVNGGDLTTTSTTATLFNTTATTLNIGQAATTVSFGATTGTATFRNATSAFDGTIDVAEYVRHAGDTDTYIRFPSADTIALGTANVERMRITSTGNVGIGTTSTLATTQLAVFGGNVQIGTSGRGLVFPDGTFQNTAFSSANVVTSFSAGTTGLTPNTATTGAVTLGGTLGATNGGTGQSTVTTGDLLYGSATNTWSKLAGVATGNVLISGGVGTAPSWGKIGLTTHVSGVLPVANGGTNSSSASGTALDNITGFSGTGIIRRTGAGTYTFGTAVNLTSEVTGVLPLANGGTNKNLTASNGGIVYTDADSMEVLSASATSGNVLISGGAGAPSWGQYYTSSNVASSIVSRDASGDFAANNITSNTITMTYTVDVTGTYTTAAATTQVTVDTFAAGTYRAAEYQISMKAGTNYAISRLTVIHDGTTAYLTEYDSANTNGFLVNYDAVYNAGTVELKAEPTSATITELKISRKLWVV